MDSEIKALRRRVRAQGVVLCALLTGWLLSATPAASLVKATVLDSFLADLVQDQSEILAQRSNQLSERFDRASKVATQTTDVIRVKGVQIVNDAGKVVARFGSDGDGNGALFIDNADGETTSFMIVDYEGEGFVGAWGPDGRGVNLRVNSAGGAVDVVSGTGDVVGMGIDGATGEGALGMKKKDGGLVGISASSLGSGLVMRANDGSVAGLVINPDGHGGLVITDEQNNNEIRLRVDDMGNRELELGDGRFRATVDATGKGVAETRGPENALIWSSENANVGGTSGLRGDLDNDGDVDIADFLVFVENFGKTTGG